MKNDITPNHLHTLRFKAEEILKQNKQEATPVLSETEMLKLIHEFEVHQIELELQNEELKAEAIKAKDATELYDFAPVGYFTLSEEGEILKLNHSGAEILGKDRSLLINSRFAFFVSNETKPVFNLFQKNVFSSKTIQSCEITLSVHNIALRYFHLTGIAFENAEYCLVTVTDQTERKQAEEVGRALTSRLELAMQSANMAWWEMNISTGAVSFEKRKAEMLGYPPENFKHYTDFTDLLHPDDYDKAMNAMRKHFSGELDKYEVEYRI